MNASVSTEPRKPLTVEQKLALANKLFREYHALCFWHMKPDLVITEATQRMSR